MAWSGRKTGVGNATAHAEVGPVVNVCRRRQRPGCRFLSSLGPSPECPGVVYRATAEGSLSDRLRVLLRTGVLALLHRQIWRESPDGSPLLLALPWLFRSLHTHFIELQPWHTLEQVPFLVLAKQGWNVSEACRLLDDVAHPTHSTNLRSGSVCRSY
jgi:hypothetical protein